MDTGNHKPNTLALAAGTVIGALWIAMALAALVSAIGGFRRGLLDWFVGWGLVGVLLLVAGGAAIVGTAWHQFRVARGGGH